MLQKAVSSNATKTLAFVSTDLLLIGLLSYLLTACGPNPRTPSVGRTASPQDYVGRVIDETTQAVIDGAQVSLDMPGEGDPTIAYTDAEGVFHFNLLIDSPISATIRVDAAGYRVYTRNITISSNQSRFEDIRLARLEPTFTSAVPTLPTINTASSLTSNVTSVTQVPRTQNPAPTQPQNPPSILPSKTFTASAPPPPPTNPPISGCIELLNGSWHLAGSGPLEEYDGYMGYQLQGRTYIQVTFDLHGFTILAGDASAIFFDQPPFGAAHYASLADYAENGKDGPQTVNISLSAFSSLNLNEAVGTLHTRFWSQTDQTYVVDITSIKACT